MSGVITYTRSLLLLEIDNVQTSVAQVNTALGAIERNEVVYDGRMCLLTMYWIATNAKRHSHNLNFICRSFNYYVDNDHYIDDSTVNTLRRIVDSVITVVNDELSVDRWDHIIPFLYAQVQVPDENDLEDLGRLENIKELRSVAIEFPNLIQFLENVALVEAEYLPDQKIGDPNDAITLMTLHSAKGLEFNNVVSTIIADTIYASILDAGLLSS